MAIGPLRFLRGPASRMLTSMLLGITLALSAGCLAGAWWFRTRAPAVALGLAGMLAAGLFAFHQAHGRHGVPQDVAVAASQSLLAVGLVGLLVTGRGPSRLLRRAAAAVVAATPLLGYLLAILLLDACPLYVTEGSGFCYHEHDVLGGWISGVVALFVFDAVMIAVLLLLSARLIDRIVRYPPWMLPVGSVLVDFDGTACSHDVAEHLLIEFADPSWAELDEAWERGELDTREVVAAQAAMLDAPLEEMVAFALEHCPVDPTFAPFVRWLEGVGIPVSLVSDGFGFYIAPLLREAGLDHVTVVTNTWSPAAPGSIGFDNGHPECVGCGTCKMNAVLAARARGAVAFVGEGQSDRFAALYGDVVFAKDALVSIATGDGVPFLPWEDFDDVRVALEGLGALPGPIGGERCPGWRLP